MCGGEEGYVLVRCLDGGSQIEAEREIDTPYAQCIMSFVCASRHLHFRVPFSLFDVYIYE